MNYKKRRTQLINELKDLVEESNLEWDDKFIDSEVIDSFEPKFEPNDDNQKWYHIIIGKLMMLTEIELEFENY